MSWQHARTDYYITKDPAPGLRATGMSQHQHAYHECLLAAASGARSADGNSTHAYGRGLTVRWAPTDNVALYDSRNVAPRRARGPRTPPRPVYNDADVRGSSASVSWDLGAVQLESITAYRALRAAASTCS